ncbi:MAG TPA: hypothetical protein VJG90_05680 [Candidatus Nanoarchaeia archaeon]|nr:hypothetical protein [Candidatus Nanoarchaeia archaeon]
MYNTAPSGYQCQQPLYQVQNYVNQPRQKKWISGTCTCMKQGPCRGTCLPREVAV